MITEKKIYVRNTDWRILKLRHGFEELPIYHLQRKENGLSFRIPFTRKRITLIKTRYCWPFELIGKSEYRIEHKSIEDALKHLRHILEYETHQPEVDFVNL